MHRLALWEKTKNTAGEDQLPSVVPHYYSSSLFGGASPNALLVSMAGVDQTPVFFCDEPSSCSHGESVSSKSSKFVCLSSSSIMDMLAKCKAEFVAYKHSPYNCYPYQSVLRSLSLSKESSLTSVLTSEGEQSLANG